MINAVVKKKKVAKENSKDIANIKDSARSKDQIKASKGQLKVKKEQIDDDNSVNDKDIDNDATDDNVGNNDVGDDVDNDDVGDNASSKSLKSQQPIAMQPVVLSQASNKDNMSGKPERLQKQKVNAAFVDDRVITENADAARDLYSQSRYGTILDNGKVQLSLLEGLYLLEKGRLSIVDGKDKSIDFESFMKKARKIEGNFYTKYCVYKDIRNRGYIIKTALKFGADFRVYDRGVKPGEDHARWVVFPVHEGSTMTWYDFAAKNRVAHSTKKRLMIAIVDEENDVTYYEIRWIRP